MADGGTPLGSTVGRDTLRPLASPTTARDATATVRAPDTLPPAAAARLATALNETVSVMHSTATPSYDSLGRALAPGRGHGVGVPSARTAAHTATGVAYDPFGRRRDGGDADGGGGGGGGGPPRTLSELRHSRRMAMRADPSYDLDGDGTVSQKDFFFATKFDRDGDGNLTLAEKLAARKLARAEGEKYTFVKTSGPTASAHHRVMQRDGTVVSEQLDGWAALTRAKAGGGSGAPGSAGGGLPFEVKGATAGMGAGAGLVKETVDVDIDDSDNIALMHTAGQEVDYDTVVVKPQHRAALQRSGEKSLSALRHSRKMKQRADMSYDLDGDGMVSQKDYFFAVRFDKDGGGVLDPEERAAAAHAMRNGFGTKFAFLRGSGPADAAHRVMQRDGAIMSEETEGGWNSLTAARAQGSTVRIGGDGQLKDGSPTSGSGAGGGGSPASRVAHAVDMDEAGRVALQHVRGAVVDFDTVTVKPQFRPALLASGSRTASELALRRRKERYPDLSMDLDGDGAVSQADYWFSKRYDVDDNNRLSPDEKDKARRDYDEGYQKRFVTLNSSSGPGMAHRVFQMDGGVVLSEGEGVLAGGGGGGYDATVRLPTMGVRPGLDLPPDRMMLPASGITRTGALAGTYSSALRSRSPPGTKPVAVGSLGVVPGVSRVVLRNPDGTQEAYGGYAGGMGAGPLNNVTGTLEAVMGRPVGPGHVASPTQAPRTVVTLFEPDGTIAPPPPFTVKPDNINTFSERGQPHEVFKHAPFALAGEGGVAESLRRAGADAAAAGADGKTLASDMGLLTRTQLVAARRVRARVAEHTDADSAAGLHTGSVGPHPNGEGEDAGGREGVGDGASSLGESVLRATMAASNGRAAALPAYMVASLANRNQLPLAPGDLPHETVKPGALPEGVRTLESSTASSLAALRTREAKGAALALTSQAPDAVAMPDVGEAGYNDHHAHGRPLVSEGQHELAKTQTQLAKKRLAERVGASLAFAPPEPYGVHGKPLPSFAKKLNGAGVPWYADRAHLDGVTTNFGGSALDASAVGASAAAATAAGGDGVTTFRGLPDFIEAVPPEYDPALRHTVRDTGMHGHTFASTASAGASRVGLGARPLRLVADGMLREEEEVRAAEGDPFKTRVVHPHQLGRYLRKQGLTMPENPGRINPWAVAEAAAAAAAADATTFRPAFDTARAGGRAAHTLHKNLGHAGNGLPGPSVDRARVEAAVAGGRTWSSAVIKYKQATAGTDERLDDTGKVRLIDPKEHAPLYSSFSPDNVFHGVFVTGNMAHRPRSPERDDPPPRRTSIYGAAVALPDALSGGSLAGDARYDGSSGGGGDAGALGSEMNGYDSMMTPGGSWTGGRGGGGGETARSLGGGGAAAAAALRRQQPTRAVERAPLPTSLVETLTRSGGGGAGGGGKAGKAPPLRALSATGGVRTGGFARA